MIDTRPSDQLGAEGIRTAIENEAAVLLFYHAEWSGPCNHAKDILGMDEIKPLLIPINIDQSPDWMKKVGGGNGIGGVPYFEYYCKGQRVSSMQGITSIADLNNFINEAEVSYEGCADFGERDP